MKIAVVGAGGVGGGFGAALAKAGADVTFIARGAHLAAMKSQGLKVVGGRGETHVVPTKATDDPKAVGPVDYVLFCVKLWDVESAGEHIKPMVGPDTAVIPLQNGIDAPERLLPILSAKAVMGRRGADQRLDHPARRHHPGRHLHATGVRASSAAPRARAARLSTTCARRRASTPRTPTRS